MRSSLSQQQDRHVNDMARDGELPDLKSALTPGDFYDANSYNNPYTKEAVERSASMGMGGGNNKSSYLQPSSRRSGFEPRKSKTVIAGDDGSAQNGSAPITRASFSSNA